jgi:hypothetical protein
VSRGDTAVTHALSVAARGLSRSSWRWPLPRERRGVRRCRTRRTRRRRRLPRRRWAPGTRRRAEAADEAAEEAADEAAQDPEAADETESPAIAQGLADPDIPREELELRLIPLTGAEHEELAEAWLAESCGR